MVIVKALILFTTLQGIAATSVDHRETASILPYDLRCEYLRNPLGIDSNVPRLSWKLRVVCSKERGLRQSAYQVLVASTEEILQRGQGDLWDSGRVNSDQSIHVLYAGKPLQSRMKCCWKVRAWDEHGHVSAWSKPAFWSMGLLKQEDWNGAKWIGLDIGDDGCIELTELKKANWIWYPEGDPRKHAPTASRYFRHTIFLPTDRSILRAICLFAGDDHCMFYVNGAHLGLSSGHPDLIGIDVAGLLHPGDNKLAVAATNGSSAAPNPAAWIAALCVEFDEGPPLVVLSDRRWKCSKASGDGWKKPNFDDSQWVPAMDLGNPGITPWGIPWEDPWRSEHRRLPARYLRREFEAGKSVRQATAYMCGLGFCELYLNGRKVDNRLMDPTQSRFDKRAMYVTFDVTNYFQDGQNSVGVILGNGRFFAPRLRTPTATPTFGYPKLLFQMRIEYVDGTSETIVSDESWKITDQGPIRANNEFDGEEYDARLEQDGWAQPGFYESAWKSAQIVSAPGPKLISQMLEPMRVIETLHPVAMRNPKPGVFVADFGQNLYGMVRLKVNGQRGTRVQVRTAFDIHPDGTIDMAPNRTSKSTDVYVLRGQGPEVWSPRFRGQGTRYAEITGYPGTPTDKDVELLVVHTDLERVGEFFCSNDLVNRIYANVVRSVRMQERGVPMDPDRDERQAWLSVSDKTSETEGYIYNVAAFYTSFLGECRIDQTLDGNLSDAGSFWPFYSSDPIWPSVVTNVPWSCYLMYGDRRILEQNYSMMKRWVQFQVKRLDADLIHRQGYYGDWVDAYSMDGRASDNGATSVPLMGTAYTCYNVRLLANLAKLLGHAEDRQYFLDLGEKMAEAFGKEFFDPKLNTYQSGTQTSYVLPLAFDLVASANRQAVIDNLVRDILVDHEGHLSVGCVGTKWLMQTLTDIGHPDVAYTILTQTTRPGWGYTVTKGGTSIWERWDNDTRDPGMNGQSQTILAGYLGAWMYQTLGGICYDPKRPGFKHIIMRPHPVGDLTHVRATHECLYGQIVSEWRISNKGTFHWEITVPVNTTATVYVPASRVENVTEGGVPILDAKALSYTGMQDDRAVFEVQSGSYLFKSKQFRVTAQNVRDE